MRALLLALLISTFLTSFGQDHVPNEIMVQFKSTQDYRAFLNEYLNKGVYPKEFIRKNLAVIHHSFEDDKSFLKEVRNNKHVALAQFNHKVTYRGITPNDSLFDQQWSLASVKIQDSWERDNDNLTSDGDTIVLAVIDEGFKDHKDINYFYNYAEIPDNNIDDDSNGYKDDFWGYNVRDMQADHVNDSQNHGTHIAGIIGAKGNNDIGIAGICWNGKVLAISKGKDVTESLVLRGYQYALRMRKRYNESNGTEGAFVVATNSSFGVDNGQPEDFPLWCSFYDSLGAQGILSIGATVNSNLDIDKHGDIPTTCPSPYFIGVTNSTNANEKANAGYGPINIDLAAPGTGILSTINNASYGKKSGTSMAGPHVVGAIGVMYDNACDDFTSLVKSNPDSAAIHVKKVLLRSVTVYSEFDGKVASKGILNIDTATSWMQCNRLNVSIKEKLVNKSYFYPNPNNGSFRMNENVREVNIYNTFGQLIKQYNSSNIGSELRIDTPGFYHAEIITQKGEHLKQSIVIIKQ